jgi:PAS domain S-box-containing protein
MEHLLHAVNGRLDFVFFVYGLSFSAMGLLLFVQPRRESSFAIAEELWLLGWFGLIHGANEFLDMWALIRDTHSTALAMAKLFALAVSYIFLLEFGRRALKALLTGPGGRETKVSLLVNKSLTPALALLALTLSALSVDFMRAAPVLFRLLVGFPGALLAGLAFLGYCKFRDNALARLKARNYFIVAGLGFIAYAVLGGLVVPKGDFFPATLLNTETFMEAARLPVQLFRALCAMLIFGSIVGALRIFREGALQAAQQELLDIIEFFPDATFVIDSDRKVIAWNRALEKMTGVHKSEMLGKGDFAYSVPFYGVRRPILIDLIGGTQPEAEKLYEYVNKRADGAIYAEVFVPSLYNGIGAHVWVTASPLQDKEGRVYGAIESVRDITDRKAAEEALHQSEAQYRALIETTNTGFLIIDKDGRVLDANQEYVRLTGHKTLAEIHGRPVLDWTAEYEREKNAKAIESCARTGHIRNFEIDYAAKDGSVTPVELNATIVEIAGERRILTLCRDISDRRRAEEALRESEERNRMLVDTAPTGIVVHRMGLMKFVNNKMAELVRVASPKDVIGKNVIDFIHPDFRDFVKDRISRSSIAEKPLPPAEEKLVATDGTIVDVEIVSVPITYLGEHCSMAIVQDITTRKKVEEELKAAHLQLLVANAGLEKRVEERTAQLAELNKELEAFSYSAAHDMKAPLRRVNIFAEMLEKEAGPALTAEARAHMLNIRKSVTQMTNLVEGLLTLSTTGKRPLEPVLVPLTALLAESVAEIKAENPGRAIEWTAADLPAVECDRAMLKQVFMNLLGNAAKYSRASTPARIEVTYAARETEHVIGVRDNGVGFNMDYADKLFAVFQRLHKAEEFEGTGIGLSTVKRIIARHGGRVWAESSPGKGAAFYFSLPK